MAEHRQGCVVNGLLFLMDTNCSIKYDNNKFGLCPEKIISMYNKK